MSVELDLIVEHKIKCKECGATYEISYLDSKTPTKLCLICVCGKFLKNIENERRAVNY